VCVNQGGPSRITATRIGDLHAGVLQQILCNIHTIRIENVVFSLSKCTDFNLTAVILHEDTDTHPRKIPSDILPKHFSVKNSPSLPEKFIPTSR